MQPNSFYLHPVTPGECEIIIGQLRNSSYGKTSIPVRLFKNVKNYVCNPLANLINESFNTGVFPAELKLATITPIFKKGDKTNVSNYRPISVLPLLSKVFEKAMAKRISNYLNKFDIISPAQFGFRRCRSTCDAISELTDTIYQNLNAKKHSAVAFLDITKAYDTVDHSILLLKLSQYGFRGVCLEWFRSYLESRQHCVRIGETMSSNAIINISIPQGSVLGCQLFSLYINDLPLVSNVVKPILFADDTALICSDATFDAMITKFNSELCLVSEWFIRNRLTLNSSKTVTMLFSNRRHDVNPNYKIDISGNPIDFSYEVKYLGVILDENLSFKNHVNYVSGKIAKNIGVIYRMSFYVPASVLINMYYALIYPLLCYCNIVWGGAADTHLHKLVTLQKREVRAITNSDYLAHTEPLFSQTGILKLRDIHHYLCCVLAYKKSNILPFATHRYDTRISANYVIPEFHRLTISQRSLSYTLPFKFNQIPINIRTSETLKVFKKQLKLHITDNYDGTVDGD